MIYFICLLATVYVQPHLQAFAVLRAATPVLFLVPIATVVLGGWLRARGREDQVLAAALAIGIAGILTVLLIFLVFNNLVGGGGLAG
jgi:hypothetical protein